MDDTPQWTPPTLLPITPTAAQSPEHDGLFFRLNTGKTGCQALFQPSRYLLTLEDGEQRKRIELGYSGSRLLERLLRTPGEVVPRDELLKFAWSERVVGQGSLNQQIYTLRQLLADEQQREIIQTLPRRGYLINPHMLITSEAEQPPTAEQPAEPCEPPAPAVPPAPRSARQHWPAALAMGIMLFAGSLLVRGHDKLPAADSHGQLNIHYLATTSKKQAQLQKIASPVIDALADIAQAPLTVTVSRTGDYVQLLCHSPNSSQSHWLEMHHSRLNSLSQQNLSSCLL